MAFLIYCRSHESCELQDSQADHGTVQDFSQTFTGMCHIFIILRVSGSFMGAYVFSLLNRISFITVSHKT